MQQLLPWGWARTRLLLEVPSSPALPLALGAPLCSSGRQELLPKRELGPREALPSPRGCEELARGCVPRQGWGVWRTPSSGICGEPCDAPGIKAGMSFLLFPAPQPLLIPPIVSNSALFSWPHSPFFLSLLTPDFTENFGSPLGLGFEESLNFAGSENLVGGRETSWLKTSSWLNSGTQALPFLLHLIEVCCSFCPLELGLCLFLGSQ